MEKYHGNTVEYWKQNAEKDYLTTPISILKYIIVLEEQAEQLRKQTVVERNEQLSCGRNITTCVFYKDGGKCSNPEYCRDQTT